MQSACESKQAVGGEGRWYQIRSRKNVQFTFDCLMEVNAFKITITIALISLRWINILLSVCKNCGVKACGMFIVWAHVLLVPPALLKLGCIMPCSGT